MADWSPKQYLAFANERSRPARDLLAQVPPGGRQVVYDLGCGPGNSTALLSEAYPQAVITGVDNSQAMLAAARLALPHIAFELADLNTWLPPHVPDLLFSNATFQWLPDHIPLLQRFSSALGPGGVLALQMPDNIDEPSHRLMRETAANGPWADKLADAAAARALLPGPLAYYAALKPMCSRLDIWHTIYNHPLKGAEDIVQFVSSTGLRPFLAPLNEGEREHFLERYTRNIADAYPALEDGTVLLRFPRLFLLAVR
jgi:trans-aconitate 2-methyltransferase